MILRVDARSTSAVTLVFLLVCGLLTACSKDLAPADNITASLQQWREDEVKGVFQVKLANTGTSALLVHTLSVEWSGFADAATSTPNYRVAAGDRIDLAVPVVEAQCSNPPRFDERTPTARAVAVVNGDRRFAIIDTNGVLDRMYHTSCSRQAVLARVDLRFDDTWTDATVDGIPVLGGRLIVTPRNGEQVTVTGVHGSVLLTLDPVTDLTIHDGGVAIVLGRGGRCDPHALGESKKPFVFPVTLTIDGVVAGIDLSPDEAGKATMFAEVKRRCGLT